MSARYFEVIGLDLSLTSTGLAVAGFQAHDGGQLELRVDSQRIESKGVTGATLAQRADRMDRVLTAIDGRISDALRLVVIEGPSLGQTRQGGQHDRAGLWWHVVGNLLTQGVPVVEVPPACLKKYATGKGNTSKDGVLAAAVKRYPEWDITGNDVADAVVLAAMGCRAIGHPIDDMPQLNQEAMRKVRWPPPT